MYFIIIEQTEYPNFIKEIKIDSDLKSWLIIESEKLDRFPAQAYILAKGVKC